MTTILHKRGAGKPSADDLSVGELALDTSAGAAYTKLSNGTVVEIGGPGGDSAGAGMIIQPDEPADPVTGLQWLDSTTGKVWLWDDDKWLEFPAATPDVAPVIVSEDEPEGSIGQLWYKPSEGAMYVHDGNGWQAFGSGGDGGNGNGGDGNGGAELHAEDGVLVVGGGGSGGCGMAGGGGGAGGWRWESMKFNGGDEAVIYVGSGGVAVSTTAGSSGTYSALTRKYSGTSEDVRSSGGGRGGSLDGSTATSGGSGGGSSYRPISTGKGTEGQGYDGARGATGIGGGGGGADEAGVAAVTGKAGRGGNGKMSDITGEEIYYAGGGHGGNQPNYGGPSDPSVGGAEFDKAGQDGTGAGGAGTSGSYDKGKAGGDGVVIVRTTPTPHTISGDPEVITDGSQTVYVFRGSGELKF